MAAPLAPAPSSLLSPQQGKRHGWGGRLGMGKGCAWYAKGTAHFIWSWCWLAHTAATFKLLQPTLRLPMVTVKQAQKDDTELNTEQKRRCSNNPAGRSRAMYGYHQLLLVNTEHTTLWLMLCIGKSYLPYQVHRALERFLTVLREPW